MKTTRIKARQAHPVPNKVINPVGPFPPELFRETRVVDDYKPALNEDGSDEHLGATAQNNYKPEYLYCGDCGAQVLSTQTNDHNC